MVRRKGKVQLKLIENPRQRNKTYKTRKEGLKKIAHDLAVLCNISVTVICVDPKTGKVESWPNNDQEARDVIVRYQSLSSTMQDENKLDLSSGLEAQIHKFQPDLKHAQEVNLQHLDSKIKFVHERIQLLENDNKVIVPQGSSEQECTTFWQDLMQDAIVFDDPCDPAATFSTQSEYKYEALLDFEFDTVPLNPPENSAEAAVFSSDLWMGNGDAGTDYSNYAGFGDFGQSYLHHQADKGIIHPAINPEELGLQ